MSDQMESSTVPAAPVAEVAVVQDTTPIAVAPHQPVASGAEMQHNVQPPPERQQPAQSPVQAQQTQPASVSSAAGAESNGEEEDRGSDDGDPDILDYLEEFVAKIQARTDVVSGEPFVQKMHKTGVHTVMRNELRDWVYALFIELGKICGAQAVEVSDVRDQCDDLEEEVDRQGKLIRAIAMGYVSSMALALATLELQGGNEEEKKQVATAIVQAVGEMQSIGTKEQESTQTVLNAVQQPAGPPATPAASPANTQNG